MKKFKQNFGRSYLKKWMEWFVLNLVCRLANLVGISAANLVEFGLEISELHSCENQVLFVPVNILTVWHVLASWATRHTTVYLDETLSTRIL